MKESAAGTYLQWAMGMENLHLMQMMDSSYSTLAAFAVRKFEAGESGRLEKVSAQSTADEAHVQLRKAQADIAIYATELEQWTGPLGGAVPDTSAMDALSRAPAPDSGTDPLVEQGKQRASLAEAEWKMQRSQWAPSLQGGGFYQTIDGVSPFGGYLIGTSIPLPGGGQYARTKAARLHSEAVKQQLEELRRSRAMELARTQARLAQLRESLAYYENSGAALATTLRNDAQRAYLNGDAGYLEFIQGIGQARRIDAEHLRIRYELGLTMIHLNALMGL